MIGYIQFAVNIVISRHHHRLLCPKKWTKTPLISVRSKITQTINLILYQIALTTIFDDNHQLWSKSSSLIFWVERFREARQSFSTLSILNKDTFLLTLPLFAVYVHFCNSEKNITQITTSKSLFLWSPSKSISYERFFFLFSCTDLFLFSLQTNKGQICNISLE